MWTAGCQANLTMHGIACWRPWVSQATAVTAVNEYTKCIMNGSLMHQITNIWKPSYDIPNPMSDWSEPSPPSWLSSPNGSTMLHLAQHRLPAAADIPAHHIKLPSDERCTGSMPECTGWPVTGMEEQACSTRRRQSHGSGNIILHYNYKNSNSNSKDCEKNKHIHVNIEENLKKTEASF